MKTIKHTIFKQLSVNFGFQKFTRRDIQKAIWIAQVT